MRRRKEKINYTQEKEDGSLKHEIIQSILICIQYTVTTKRSLSYLRKKSKLRGKNKKTRKRSEISL